MVSWVLYVKFRREKHCLVKDFAFLKNVCYLLKVPIIFWKTFCASGAVIVFVFYELMIDPQPTFLDPGYSSPRKYEQQEEGGSERTHMSNAFYGNFHNTKN